MVARLKLKGIDGRAPPGVKALLLKVVVPLGAGIKRLLVHSQQASPSEEAVLCVGRYHRIAGNS